MNPFVFYRFRSGFILGTFVFITTVSNAQNQNALLYHGNAFYWTDERIDTTQVTDIETGEITLRIERVEAGITRMNEERIYNSGDKETMQPVFEYNGQDEEAYLQAILKANYQDIPAFTIQKMVINPAGKPVYFELNFDDAANARMLRLKWGGAIEKAIVNMPRWQPGRHKGKPALFYLNSEIHIP